MSRPYRSIPLVVTLAASLFVSGAALAQPAQQGNTPSAVQGFSKNRDQPVQINALTLEVRDKDKVATFSGNVHVIQGEMHLRCEKLLVYYEGDTATTGGKPAPKSNAMAAAAPGPDGQGKIKRLVAQGGVTITQNDQTATGKTGVFEMKENLVTLDGNVVLTQGKNVSKGEKLVVDLTTNRSTLTGGKGVSVLIDPQAAKDAKKDGAAPAPAGRPAAR